LVWWVESKTKGDQAEEAVNAEEEAKGIYVSAAEDDDPELNDEEEAELLSLQVHLGFKPSPRSERTRDRLEYMRAEYVAERAERAPANVKLPVKQSVKPKAEPKAEAYRLPKKVTLRDEDRKYEYVPPPKPAVVEQLLPSGWTPDNVFYASDDEATNQAREQLIQEEKKAEEKFQKEQAAAKKNRDNEARLKHMEATLAIEKMKASKRAAEQPVEPAPSKKFMGIIPNPFYR